LDVKAAKTQHFSFIYGNVGNSLRISCGVWRIIGASREANKF